MLYVWCNRVIGTMYVAQCFVISLTQYGLLHSAWWPLVLLDCKAAWAGATLCHSRLFSPIWKSGHLGVILLPSAGLLLPSSFFVPVNLFSWWKRSTTLYCYWVLNFNDKKDYKKGNKSLQYCLNSTDTVYFKEPSLPLRYSSDVSLNYSELDRGNRLMFGFFFNLLFGARKEPPCCAEG